MTADLRHRHFLAAPVVVVLLAAACDPGIDYRPGSWSHVAEYRWRLVPVPGVELETSGTGGLVGSSSLSPEFTVRNHSGEAVRLGAATLDTARGHYLSEPILPGHEQWFTAAAGESKRITLSFRLPQPVGDVLVDPVVLSLTLTQGTEQHIIVIPMVRH